MGYACPVCADPQADAGHLANHLAFTAMLGDDDHEAWLEAHAEGWAEMGETELGAVVVDHVEETTFPQVFEDTAGGLEDAADPAGERSGVLFDDEAAHDHDHEGGHGDRGGRPSAGDGPVDPETEAVLEEAREMTREMLRDDDEGASGDESQ